MHTGLLSVVMIGPLELLADAAAPVAVVAAAVAPAAPAVAAVAVVVLGLPVRDSKNELAEDSGGGTLTPRRSAGASSTGAAATGLPDKVLPDAAAVLAGTGAMPPVPGAGVAPMPAGEEPATGRELAAGSCSFN
jgi:hypothetical protein